MKKDDIIGGAIVGTILVAGGVVCVLGYSVMNADPFVKSNTSFANDPQETVAVVEDYSEEYSSFESEETEEDYDDEEGGDNEESSKNVDEQKEVDENIDFFDDVSEEKPKEQSVPEEKKENEAIAAVPIEDTVEKQNDLEADTVVEKSEPVNSVQSGSDVNNFDLYNNVDQQNTTDKYVLNTNTHKIHLPSCDQVPKIKRENYETSNLSIEELKAQEYECCKICFDQ